MSESDDLPPDREIRPYVPDWQPEERVLSKPIAANAPGKNKRSEGAEPTVANSSASGADHDGMLYIPSQRNSDRQIDYARDNQNPNVTERRSGSEPANMAFQQGASGREIRRRLRSAVNRHIVEPAREPRSDVPTNFGDTYELNVASSNPQEAAAHLWQSESNAPDMIQQRSLNADERMTLKELIANDEDPKDARDKRRAAVKVLYVAAIKGVLGDQQGSVGSMNELYQAANDILPGMKDGTLTDSTSMANMHTALTGLWEMAGLGKYHPEVKLEADATAVEIKIIERQKLIDDLEAFPELAAQKSLEGYDSLELVVHASEEKLINKLKGADLLKLSRKDVQREAYKLNRADRKLDRATKIMLHRIGLGGEVEQILDDAYESRWETASDGDDIKVERDEYLTMSTTKEAVGKRMLAERFGSKDNPNVARVDKLVNKCSPQQVAEWANRIYDLHLENFLGLSDLLFAVKTRDQDQISKWFNTAKISAVNRELEYRIAESAGNPISKFLAVTGSKVREGVDKFRGSANKLRTRDSYITKEPVEDALKAMEAGAEYAMQSLRSDIALSRSMALIEKAEAEYENAQTVPSNRRLSKALRRIGLRHALSDDALERKVLGDLEQRGFTQRVVRPDAASGRSGGEDRHQNVRAEANTNSGQPPETDQVSRVRRETARNDRSPNERRGRKPSLDTRLGYSSDQLVEMVKANSATTPIQSAADELVFLNFALRNGIVNRVESGELTPAEAATLLESERDSLNAAFARVNTLTEELKRRGDESDEATLLAKLFSITTNARRMVTGYLKGVGGDDFVTQWNKNQAAATFTYFDLRPIDINTNTSSAPDRVQTRPSVEPKRTTEARSASGAWIRPRTVDLAALGPADRTKASDLLQQLLKVNDPSQRKDIQAQVDKLLGRTSN